jgi:hypothetical protein
VPRHLNEQRQAEEDKAAAKAAEEPEVVAEVEVETAGEKVAAA